MLEEALASAAEKKAKMNALNAKAFNGMKQKVKKTLRDNETSMIEYKKVCPILTSLQSMKQTFRIRMHMLKN